MPRSVTMDEERREREPPGDRISPLTGVGTVIQHRRWLAAVKVWAPVLIACLAPAIHAQEAPQYAGATDKGFLLPNGWTLSPAGAHVVLADLPLNIITLADNRHALAATSGYNSHDLVLIDLQDRKVV